MRGVSRLLIFFLVVLASCIDPLDVSIDEEVNTLIVEGAITTGSGPYTIKLTQSAKYGSIFEGFIKPVQSAKVIIRDSSGKNVVLAEDKQSPGIYVTPMDFRPVVGDSYTLLITTAVGTEYTSLPQRLIKAPEIQELSTEFRKVQIADNVYNSGLNVLATFNDDPDSRNFYMWRNSGTYKIKTFPENYMTRDGEGNPVSAPKDCCEHCWVEELNGDPTLRLLPDNNINGNTVTDVAAYIEDDGLRYFDKYLVRIELHSLSREAFQFFSLLKEQLSINGDIFDPPPATLRGNMINLTNPDENVIGFFRVSDVAIDSLFLTPEMLTEPRPLRQIDDDCQVYRNATIVEPVYW